MKVGIVSIALFIVMTAMLVFRTDYIGVEFAEFTLKNKIEEVASVSSMYIDEERFSDGYIEFKDEEIIKLANNMLGECDEYTIIIYDDSFIKRSYDQAGGHSEAAFTFPTTFVNKKGETTEVEKAGVIIEAKTLNEFYSLQDLKGKKTDVERTTMYVVEGR